MRLTLEFPPTTTRELAGGVLGQVVVATGVPMKQLEFREKLALKSSEPPVNSFAQNVEPDF